MAKNTVVLKGNAYVQKEAKASEAITPGHLVEFGGANELRKHSTIGGEARKAFAVENDIIGKGITDDYASGESVKYVVCPAGTEIYAIVSAAQTKGNFLESNGDGRLKTSSTPNGESSVAVAMETVGAAGRCRVEVL